MKIGEVEKVKWYILEDNRVVSFHTARVYDLAGGENVTFFSERQILPSQTARRLGIKYDFMRNAIDAEVNATIREKGLLVKAVVEV